MLQHPALSFALGLVAGAICVPLAVLLVARFRGRAPRRKPPSNALPDLTITATRELVERMIDDALVDVKIPLVTLRDPYVQLTPDATIVLRLRGDTALLGAQTIVLRLRVEPAGSSVRVATESAAVQGVGSVGGGLTAGLDRAINAQLAGRVSFDQRWEVLAVTGDEHELVVRARMLG